MLPGKKYPPHNISYGRGKTQGGHGRNSFAPFSARGDVAFFIDLYGVLNVRFVKSDTEEI